MEQGSANRSFDWLEDLKAQAQQRLHETQQMTEQLEKLKVTASNSDSSIKVTVDSNGIVTDLDFGAAIKNLAPDELAQQVMATMAKARNGVGKQASQMVKDTIGLESETGKAIMAGYRKRLRKPTSGQEGQAS